MKQIKIKVLKSTQKNRIGVQETLEHIPNTNGGGGDGRHGGGNKPRGMPLWFKEWSKNQFEPLVNDVNSLKNDVNSLKIDVNSLKNDVNYLTNDVNSMKKTIDYNVDIGVLKKPK